MSGWHSAIVVGAGFKPAPTACAPLRRALAVLFLLAAGCAPAPDAKAPPPDLKAFLPADLRDWVLSEFSPDTLYLVIDGEAEQFKAYGFVRMIQLKPRAGGFADPPAAFVRLYDMGHPVNAFGVYSTMRDPSNEFADDGAEAFWSGSGWTGFKGRFFFEVERSERKGKAAAEALADARKDALGVARALAERLSGDESFPPALRLLDIEGKKPKTEFFSNDGILGKGELGRTFRCEWETASGKGVAFASVFPDERAAEEALLAIVRSGGLSKEDEGAGDWTLEQRGSFLLGVLGPKGPASVVMRSLEARAKEASSSGPLDLPPAPAVSR